LEKLHKILETKEIKLFLIPGGLTSILQPLDICFNKPFKVQLKDKFNEWFNKRGIDPSNVGKTGNIQLPKYDDVISMGLNSWNQINSDLIEKSFKVKLN
jgi:hypothetical protein